MTARDTLRDAVVAAIGGLTLSGTPAVAAWAGDAQLFNPDAEFPRVYVRLGRVTPGPNQSIGGMAYLRDVAFDVYVTTRDAATVGAAVDGDAQALAILDAIETGLPGDLGATGRRIFFADEAAEQAPELGLYLYRQTYTVRDPR